MVKLTKEQKIHNYAAKLAFCKTGDLYEFKVENKKEIGKYCVSRLVHHDKVMGGVVEDNYHYFFDKKGIPHSICITYAGSANGNKTTTKQQMIENQAMLQEIKAAMLYINEPRLFKIKAGKIEKALNECAENENFSQLHVESIVGKTKYKNLVEQELENYSYDPFIVRDERTPEEMGAKVNKLIESKHKPSLKSIFESVKSKNPEKIAQDVLER